MKDISVVQKQFPAGYFGDAVAEVPSAAALDASLPRFRRTFRDFVRSLPHGAKVLDVGCGKGKFSAMLLAYRPDLEVHGMDITDVSALLPRGIEFQVGSAEDLERMYVPDSFDAVICFHVIEHLLYPLALTEGIRTVLKDGGHLYLETPNWSRGLYPFLDTYFWNDYTHIRIFTKRTLQRLLSDYGFHITALMNVCSSSLWGRRDSHAFRTLVSKGGDHGKRKSGMRRYFGLPFIVIQKALYRLAALTVNDVLVATAVNHKHAD